MRLPSPTPTLRAFLGRHWGCGAGGHSMGNTGPESTATRARLATGGARNVHLLGREPVPARGAREESL